MLKQPENKKTPSSQSLPSPQSRHDNPESPEPQPQAQAPKPAPSIQSSIMSQYNKQQQQNKQQFTLQLQNIDNAKILRNNFIFGILLLLTHAGLCVCYGAVVQVPSFDRYAEYLLGREVGVEAVLGVIVMALLIVGIMLVFGYTKKLVWSAMGLNLCLCCLSIQIYLIANNLITRLGLSPTLSSSTSPFILTLTNTEIHSSVPLTSPLISPLVLPFGNTLFDALKCSLSVIIIFSNNMGKIGLLQMYAIGLIGTVGYEINRQILQRMGIDYGASSAVFGYGGFGALGVGLGLWALGKCRDRKRKEGKGMGKKGKEDKERIMRVDGEEIKERQSEGRRMYTGSLHSGTIAIIGLGILFVCLPVFVFFPSFKYYGYFKGILNIAPISVLHSISSGVIIAIGASFIINQKITIRDFINGTIASGICGLSTSFFISLPVYSMITGAVGALSQIMIQNLIQKRSKTILSTYSFTVFGIQSLVSTLLCTIFKSALIPKSPSFLAYSRTSITSSMQPIVLGLISSSIGLFAGLLIALFLTPISVHRQGDHYHDRVYWFDQEKVIFMEHQSVLQDEYWKSKRFVPEILHI